MTPMWRLVAVVAMFGGLGAVGHYLDVIGHAEDAATVDRSRLGSVLTGARDYLLDWRPTGRARSWAGLRPVTPDDLPVIGPASGHHGLYVATGRGTLGVTLAPITAQLLVSEITTGRSVDILEPFRVERFEEGVTRCA